MSGLLNTISEVGGTPFLAEWNVPGAAAVLLSQCYGDPILQLAARGNQFSAGQTRYHVSHTWKTRRTAVVSGPKFSDSLRIALRISGGTRDRRPSGNWRRRTRYTLWGSTDYSANPDVATLSSYLGGTPWQTPSQINDFPVYLANVTAGSFPTFSALFSFAKLIEEVVDQPFYRLIGAGNHRHCTLSNLQLSEDEISYRSLNIGCGYFPHPSYHKGKGSYDLLVRIFRDPSVSEGYNILLGGASIVYDNDVFTLTNPRDSLYEEYVHGGHIAINEVQPGSSLVFDSSKHSILGASPMLFHTQSQAMVDALGDVSRNFESFFELPSTAELLLSILSWPTAFSSRLGKAHSFVLRARLILKALAAGYLAYIFAIKPALASAKDAIESVKILPQPKYEATKSHSGDASAFLELPGSLRSYIVSDLADEEEVIRFKYAFHTEIVLDIDDAYVSRVLASTARTLRQLGLTPEPRIIWQILPFSFVVDWFLPISTLIEDAQAYLGSFKTPIATIGHSVFVEFQTSDGKIYSIYIRSDNSTRPLDPPHQSWIEAGGVYVNAAIPLALLHALG